MKVLIFGGLAALFLLAATPNESPYEPLVIVRPATAVEHTGEAQELVTNVNALRANQGLSPVIVDAELSRAALLHAKDMASRRFFGHFSPDGRSLPDRLAQIGYRWTVAAENIALDADARHANAALALSASHRANILDPRVSKIGVAALSVGVGAALFVEDFAS